MFLVMEMRILQQLLDNHHHTFNMLYCKIWGWLCKMKWKETCTDAFWSLLYYIRLCTIVTIAYMQASNCMRHHTWSSDSISAYERLATFSGFDLGPTPKCRWFSTSQDGYYQQCPEKGLQDGPIRPIMPLYCLCYSLTGLSLCNVCRVKAYKSWA